MITGLKKSVPYVIKSSREIVINAEWLKIKACVRYFLKIHFTSHLITYMKLR